MGMLIRKQLHPRGLQQQFGRLTIDDGGIGFAEKSTHTLGIWSSIYMYTIPCDFISISQSSVTVI